MKYLRSTRISVASSAIVAVAALALAACGSSGGSSTASAQPTTPAGAPATVGVANTSLGNVLVNAQGRTLYLFQKDTGTTSTCTDSCAASWPPLVAPTAPTSGTGANAALVGTTKRKDGTLQVTYNRHPVYLFTGDTKAGDTNGQGVVAFGASWFALSPSGDQVSGSSSTTASGGGSGY